MVDAIYSLIPSIRRVFITALCLLSMSANAADTVTATIDQNPVLSGNKFVLTITANFDIDASDWDNSALLKNFVVGQTSTQNQVTYSNGSVNRSVTLTTLLIARHAGVFIIPAFEFDDGKTQPIKVTVIDAATSNNSNNNGSSNAAQSQTGIQQNVQQGSQQNIQLKNTLSTDTIYIGQQFIYTSKLYIADNTEMQAGNLTNPEAKNAIIKQVGKDTSGNEIINGRRFQTITRNYAITLNKAGDTRIIPSRFEGQVSTYRPGYRFANRKPIVIQGKPHIVNVLAIPKDYQGEWLASDFVQLIEEWQPADSAKQGQFKQGEPTTRTITLTVANIDKTALPDLEVNWPTSVKVYPDKPQLSQFVQQGRYFAQQVISYAIIPNQDGKLVFPEVKVTWFNTQTGRTELASIPAKTVIVKANNELPAPTLTSQLAESQSASQPQPASSIWQWLTLVFAILWLLTLIAWFVSHNKAKTATLNINQTISDKSYNKLAGDVWTELTKALKANDAKLSQDYLQQWFKQQSSKQGWPEVKSHNLPHNLDQLPLTDECRAACLDLTRHLYGASQSAWQGTVLLGLLTDLNNTQKPMPKSSKSNIVQNLNPWSSS